MNAAAIAAQLVDMRNVGTHKVLKLTIHIPEEQALAAIAAFGWPTGVDPVPIAIARLNPETEVMPPECKQKSSTETPPRQQETVDGAKTKTAFRDMRMANQAGILCAEVPFQRFLAERLKEWNVSDFDEDKAKKYVRSYCNVQTRRDIRPRTVSGDRWEKLVAEYRRWMHAPELVA